MFSIPSGICSIRSPPITNPKMFLISRCHANEDGPRDVCSSHCSCSQFRHCFRDFWRIDCLNSQNSSPEVAVPSKYKTIFRQSIKQFTMLQEPHPKLASRLNRDRNVSSRPYRGGTACTGMRGTVWGMTGTVWTGIPARTFHSKSQRIVSICSELTDISYEPSTKKNTGNKEFSPVSSQQVSNYFIWSWNGYLFIFMRINEYA